MIEHKREDNPFCRMYCEREIRRDLGETVYWAWDWICCRECWREIDE